jgi:poly(3-hydroxybutyrate) depolymerase
MLASERWFVFPIPTYRYINSQDNNEVWLYKIADWGHGWSRTSDDTGIDTAEVIWEFFSRY